MVVGLYDDEDAAVEGGDVNSAEYFWAKALHTGLNEALKMRQPEDKVGQLCGKLLTAVKEALKTYESHTDLLDWQKRGESIKGKIDPKAKASQWAGSFPFGKDEFTRGWAALSHARFAKESADWRTVFEQARSVSGKWYHCTSVSKKYPDAWKTFFDEGMIEAKELFKEGNTKK